MNWVDIAIIFVIAVTSLYSLMWGFIRQLMLVACFAVALYVALNFSGFVFDSFTSGWVDSETIARAMAGGLVFVGTFVVAAILTIPLFRLVRARSIRFLDHLVGLAFGFVLGWAIAGLAWIGAVLTFQIKGEDPTVQQTRLLPYVHTASITMLELAEQAPFLQSDETQLLILDAWDAMREANPVLGHGADEDEIQAAAPVLTGADDDPIAGLISSNEN